MRPLLPFLLLVLLGSASAWSQTFPELKGPVVDQARVLDATSIRKLTQDLLTHERETSNQVVVVTLTSLEGHDIADYGYRLGRHWGIGQEGRNNGVLLIVAPTERKVRIEVGYGLEGALPDVLAHRIIEDDILPRFRQGNMASGISEGARMIMRAIKGEYEPLPQTSRKSNRQDPILIYFILAIGFLGFFAYMRTLREGNLKPGEWGWRSHRGRFRYGRGRRLDGGLPISTGGGFGSGGFGGGFSGGGGGFGGGGASGGW